MQKNQLLQFFGTFATVFWLNFKNLKVKKTPIISGFQVVGMSGLEPPTPTLSGVHSLK